MCDTSNIKQTIYTNFKNFIIDNAFIISTTADDYELNKIIVSASPDGYNSVDVIIASLAKHINACNAILCKNVLLNEDYIRRSRYIKCLINSILEMQKSDEYDAIAKFSNLNMFSIEIYVDAIVTTYDAWRQSNETSLRKFAEKMYDYLSNDDARTFLIDEIEKFGDLIEDLDIAL